LPLQQATGLRSSFPSSKLFYGRIVEDG